MMVIVLLWFEFISAIRLQYVADLNKDQIKSELPYLVPSLDRFQTGINQCRVNGLIICEKKFNMNHLGKITKWYKMTKNEPNTT